MIKIPSELPDGFKEKFENMITKSMTEARIPGLSVAFVKDNRIIYARGFGARNKESNLPATPDTLYGIGSCTKSFTALAIMQLVEQKKLELRDPISKFIPMKIEKKGNHITIHDLLTHSSGIPSLAVAEIIIYQMTGIEDRWIPMSSLDDFLVHINGASDEVASEPGKRFFYFNSGYTLLGEVIERVSKMTYENYVRKNILDPLRMNRSTFSGKDFEKDSDIMTPYFLETEKESIVAKPVKLPSHKLKYAPGGLLSSVIELSNYLMLSMNGVFGGAQILEPSLLEEMQKIHIETDMFRNRYGVFGREGYGYGWAILEDFLGHKLVIHGGSIGVSSAHISFVPELKIGVVEAANAGRSPNLQLLGGLVSLMGRDPEKEIPFFEIDAKLSMLAGEYKTYKDALRISVVKRGPLLYLEPKDKSLQISAPLIPETKRMEDFRFYIISEIGEKRRVEFEVNSSGKIDLYLERYRFHKTVG
ncbi:MAG: serine hydrolase [Candidatus Hodarchaeota archaeon]